MDLAPVKMKDCGKEFITLHERNNNFQGQPIRGAFAEFINVGQTLVWLNRAIPIMPGGGYWSVKNPCFNAIFSFHTVNDPPSTNSKVVMSGNNLVIIIHKNPDSEALLSQLPGNAAAGGGTPTELAVTANNDTVTADFTIPADTARVSIRNVGGLSPATAQVNGNDLLVGGEIRSRRFGDGVNIFTPPEYEVVTNGSAIEYYYETIPAA